LLSNPEIGEVVPFDWSRDGRWIAALVKRVDKTAQIGLINPADGSLRVLRTVAWTGVGGLRFSPDSKQLAFHQVAEDESFNRDVHVIAVDASTSAPVAVTPADESVVDWTSDGNRLLISSDRGSGGIWAVPFRQGIPDTRLELVRADIGYIRPLALTTSGTLFYNQLRPTADIHMVPVDASTARLTSAATQPIRKFSGFNWQPDWSSDGQYLAYVSQRDLSNASRHVMVIHSVASGTTMREIYPALSYVSWPRWSPDGRQFIARGADLKGRSGIVKFDAVTGAAALVVPNEVCSNLPVWSTSGESFFCYRARERAIQEVAVDSGKVLRSFPNTSPPAAASPDGRYLVHSGGLLTLATGESREFHRDTPDSPSGSLAAVAWTPDSKGIVFTAIINGEPGIWLVSIDGGQRRKLVDVPVVSRDGRGITRAVNAVRINAKTGVMVYALGTAARTDLWKMENFLPPVK
jgi:Tol biopolymer transport system component